MKKPVPRSSLPAEEQRLLEDRRRERNWKRWGPYLAERQWGTVREDYSADGTCWDYLPHDHARSRAYRWGEDGLLGITDREGRMCFALALWNGRDPILKERLFGLTGPEGNHGEDVKEVYHYLDSSPTHSYLKARYRYPQAEYPYTRLVEENRRRDKQQPEFELIDTGVLDGDRFFDVIVEYAKKTPEDILIRITIANRGPEPANISVLPTLWFRNTWSWGREGQEGYWPKPSIRRRGPSELIAEHASLGRYVFSVEGNPSFLFTENETNASRLFAAPNPSPFVKDAFHEYVIRGRHDAVNPAAVGTKAAALYSLTVPARDEITLRLRLRADTARVVEPFDPDFDRIFVERIRETDEYYAARIPTELTADERAVARQAYSGLLWSKQFFHFSVKDWIEGDPSQPPPPSNRREGRNNDWPHLYNRDVISMPDKWEYPWYAAWDLAFHMVAFARVDPHFAKEQLVLFLREWYMHPNGQIPAYEFAFSDVNPPVHAWAAWRVYKMTGERGARDQVFLARVFQKLNLNFTWWVNRKDARGRNLFGGGFLGMDNIGVFDRSRPLPTGGFLEQADGTAWMAFYCGTMLSIALELATTNLAYEDMASKYFEHFVAIADAMNRLGKSGLWNEEDGFYYDQLHVNGMVTPLRLRSMVGLVPLLACEILENESLDRFPSFGKRMHWFLEHRKDLAESIAYAESGHLHEHRLLAIPNRARLERVLRYLLDENEFLAPHGIRSLSRVYGDRPYVLETDGHKYEVAYTAGESTTGFFGGNSNWRGPIWFPLNYLLIEALERYDHFYGDSLSVEYPTGSGRKLRLGEVAIELSERLCSLFLADDSGHRAFQGNRSNNVNWRDLINFHEYFHAETGMGLGASHQTGWTALVVRCLEHLAQSRANLQPENARKIAGAGSQS